ncbi:hypothetical protein XENOCAPTIV_024210, partial [Xenoophorus captivus]
ESYSNPLAPEGHDVDDHRAAAQDKSAAEKRRQLIQESKFLGGDMEHTHLVKGLDFALLQKVRPWEQTEPTNAAPVGHLSPKHLSLCLFYRSGVSERNELFLPGRMAYVVDLDDEFTDTDIPTTLIRSKADCPSMEAQTTLTTNDIVISKLTQILSYLRQGTRHKKMKKKDKGKLDDKRAPEADLSIFEDTGDYIPSATSKPSKDKDRHRGRDEDSKSRRHAYFEKPRGDDHQLIEVDTAPGSIKDQIKMINEKFGGAAANQWQNQEPYPCSL